MNSQESKGTANTAEGSSPGSRGRGDRQGRPSRGGSTGRSGGRARGSRGGRGGGRGGASSRYTPYSPPTIPSSRVCMFLGPGGYSSAPPPFDESRLDASGIEKVHFSGSFDVQDSHLDAIRSRPALAARLKALVLGDSDNGYGTYISDQTIMALANACPNLVYINLESVNRLTDDALIAICQACPLLESLRITGHDKSRGSIEGEGLKFLTENPTVAPNLKDLNLMDQRVNEKVLKLLSKTRKTLAIASGESLGNGISDNMVAAMSGGAISQVMLGGKMVSFGMDMGMFGGGGFGMALLIDVHLTQI